MSRSNIIASALLALLACWSSPASAQLQVEISQGFPWQGLSIFTIVMALLYAGHMAQDRTSLGWRLLLFILGFPLTFVVSFLVVPGSQRVLGVDLPRHDLQTAGHLGEGDGEDKHRRGRHDGEGEDPAERRAEWEGIIALLIGVSVVFLFAPSTEYRTEPIDGGRYAVEKRTYWGWGDESWLAYRREGVRDVSAPGEPGEIEWTSRRWQFDASLEALFTVMALLALFGLCIADERRRRRRDDAGEASPSD